MLHFHPDDVGDHRVKDTYPSQYAVIGDPTVATTAKGQRLVAQIASWIAPCVTFN